jgi:hypothetical protein
MVHYQGSRYRQDDTELYGQQSDTARKQLQFVEKQIAEAEAIKARDPYSAGMPPVIHLPSLHRLRSELRNRLRISERGVQEAGGGQVKDDWRPAPSSYFVGSDS